MDSLPSQAAGPDAASAALPQHQRRLGLRLQGKLILAFTVLLVIALGTTVWLFADRSSDTVSDILGEQARQISQTLALAAETPYELHDVQELRQLGRMLLRTRNIVLVVFHDAKNSPLALVCRDPDLTLESWQRHSPWQSRPQDLMRVYEREMPTLGRYLQVTVPVLDMIDAAAGHARPAGAATPLLGYITVGISKSAEMARFHRVIIAGFIAGAVVCLLSLPLISGVVHRIFQPIRSLALATQRLASGDYSASVATERPDEIGMLARSFNEMVKRVHQHQQDLRVANENLEQANADLEGKVRQRTAELESTNRRLSAEIAEKEDFLRAVSHDLNAPLRNISGMATMLLLKHREQFDQDIIHRLERIRSNVEVETDLIAELLELSRIKTRRQKMETVDVDALVREAGCMFEEDLRERGIALIVETPLPSLYCERARLRQVFQNLIDNAIKYMGQGPVREIRVGCRPCDEGLEFHVHDSGMGIDKEDLPRIFYVFRRGRNSAEVNIAGKGVGLASVKSIIETYNGRIWVESESGKGSVFRFTIHRRFVPSLSGSAQLAAEAAEAAPVRGAA